MADLVGQTLLGAYEVRARLDSGTYAEVYDCVRTSDGLRVVAKVPHQHLLEGKFSEEIRDRFAAEIDASTRVQSPHLVKVLGSGDAPDGRPFLVMEYVEGIPLMDFLINNAPLRPALSGRIFAQILGTVRQLHTAGIVHRDLTPNNIMVQPPDARPILLDFGIAKLDRMSRHTMGPVGTPRYIAPEQIEGKATSKSDIFSLGAILWWALTGREYLAEFEQVGQLLRKQLTTVEPPDPREVREDIPASIATVVMQMIHPKPSFRPSAGTFLKLWENLVRSWARQAGEQTSREAVSVSVRPSSSERQPPQLRVLLLGEPGEALNAVLETLKRIRARVSFAASEHKVADATRADVDVALVSHVHTAAVARLLKRTDRPLCFVFADDDASLLGVEADAIHVLPSGASRLHARLIEIQLRGDAGTTLDLDRVQRLRATEELKRSVRAFIRSVGPWLVELESAARARDGEGMLHTCVQVERGALYVGASSVATHAQVLGRLASDAVYDMTDDALDALKNALVRDSRSLVEQLES